jgi:plastocyanin
MRISLLTIVGTMAASALLACSSSTSPGSSNGGRSMTIIASSSTMGGGYGSGGNFFFSPNPDTVTAGAPVTFQFGSVVHNVHFDTGPSLPGSIPATSNASVARTFAAAGTYTFHCSIHNFSGTVIAQ